ncbi:MAG: hypothetical protein WC656_09590 [Sulfurimonas sp.]
MPLFPHVRPYLHMPQLPHANSLLFIEHVKQTLVSIRNTKLLFYLARVSFCNS